MREDSSAAIGSAVTAPAAASGSTLKPATSSRTSRNSTAVNAAETRASATAGPVRNGSRSSASSGGSSGSRHEAIAAATAIGAWTMKTHCHDRTCVTAPPSAGPAAVPKTAAAVHRCRPSRPTPAKAATRPAAPPTAWNERATSRTPSESEAAHASEATANRAKPATPSRAGP